MLEVTLGLVFILVLLTVSLPAEANYQESVRQAAYVPAVQLCFTTALSLRLIS